MFCPNCNCGCVERHMKAVEVEWLRTKRRLTICNEDGCENPATIYVWDGPHGLSPRTNEYRLCDEHKPDVFGFEHCARLDR